MSAFDPLRTLAGAVISSGERRTASIRLGGSICLLGHRGDVDRLVRCSLDRNVWHVPIRGAQDWLASTSFPHGDTDGEAKDLLGFDGVLRLDVWGERAAPRSHALMSAFHPFPPLASCFRALAAQTYRAETL